MTRFGMVSFAPKFRLDTFALSVPCGHTVRNDGSVPPVAVVFITTLLAVIGTLPRPATCRSFEFGAVTFPLKPLVGETRESRIRFGVSGWKKSPVVES